MPHFIASRIAHAFAWLALLLPLGAHARHILDLDVGSQPAQLRDWGDYAIDATGKASFAEMLRQPQRFEPIPADSQLSPQAGQALWIRFAVPATPDDQRWYVRVVQPGLDSLTLYTRGSDESWSRQQTGDTLPVSQWALPNLYPVLPLSISAAEPTYYMMRIEASDRLRAPIEFTSESWLSWEQQRHSLVYGIYFGLLAMGAIFAIASAAVLRDTAYFWFGVWTVFAMLAAATAAGVTQLHLWPETPAWADAAQHVLPAAATVPFLIFFVEVLSIRERAERVFWPSMLLALSAAGFAVLCGIAPSPARQWLSQGTVALVSATALALSIWAWWRDERLARRILGALGPFGAALAVYAARAELGAWVEQYAFVFLLAGLALTICATYLLLASRNHGRHESHRRIAQLHEIDPLTGLVNDSVFATRLTELTERAQRFGHQSVVAFVDFPNFDALRAEFGRKHSLALLLRLAERLNAMVRTVDTVARLGESRFGLQVDGPVAPSRARALCAKVVAHCITPMAGLPMGMIAKPRIAMALVPAHGAVAQDVLARLEQMLREAADEPMRVILLADMDIVRPAAPPQPGATAAPSSIATTEFLPTSATDEVDSHAA